MTVLTTIAKAGPYAGAGTTGPFTVPFRFLDAAHLRVIRSVGNVETVLVLGTDYTVSGVGATSGTVTLVAPLPVGQTLTVVRNVPATQEADYVPGDSFPAESHEGALDKLTMITQQLQEEVQRAAKLPASSPSDADALSVALLRVDANSSNINAVNANSANINAAVANATNINTVAANVTDVTNFAGVYLGARSADPATRTNGSPLQAGDLYFNTAANQMRGYSGSGWTITAPATDANLVSYLPSGTGAVATNVQSKLREFVSVRDFGAVGDGVADDTAAIQAAIDSLVPLGGVVRMPEGRYKTTSPILLKTGVSLIGDGYWNDYPQLWRKGVTSIFAEHTGAAMLSLKGAIGCTVSNLSLEGSQAARPRTGILLGRATTASAGFHTFRKVTVCGWYTTAAIYTIASEDNYWEDIITWNFGGDAPYGLVTSTQDIFAVDGLVTSTNLTNVFVQLKLIVTSPLAHSAGIFMEGANHMGSFSFFGCYITQFAGAYIRIANGNIDGLGMFGPLTFVGVSGEPLSGGNPLVGVDLTAAVPVRLEGLTITGARFQLFAGSDKNDIRQSLNLTLVQPNIVIQPSESFPHAISDIKYNKVLGGILSVGREYAWRDFNLAPGVTPTFGSPMAPPGFRIGPSGLVTFRGVVDAASPGQILFTLPPEFWPAWLSHNYTTSLGNTPTIILINVNGQVSQIAGNQSQINLNNISFYLN